MRQTLASIKFNLTTTMSRELIRYNNLKKDLYDAYKLYNLDKNEDLLLKIVDLEHQLEMTKNNFIKEFQKENRNEILEYLETKDQN